MDFSLILFVATSICGAIWLFDALMLAPRRRLAVAASGAAASESGAAATSAVLAKEPALVEQAKSFFPILLAIFLLRSFLFEPFRIPSGSMKPTLVEGDFILVNKFSYGIRLPVVNKKVVALSDPARGDVVVFRFPENPSQDFIKRVVGLPGDRIRYADKTLFVEPACKVPAGTACPQPFKVDRELVAAAGFDDNGVPADVWQEQLGEHKHQLLIHPDRVDMEPYFYQHRNEWVVPEGHYFALGDNRDRSHDGRYWGFIPDENLKGRAVAVWLHLDFGLDIPFLGWVPTGISFSRVGGIN
ncbi:signal peptidase I [Permianibacter fluminis]|uniref:signal peptidase I n=1 Tax=Permianibacter fluminis TaxID=2738515 RepID=UPI001F3F9DC7|nr:signal peptidase I [Permianibacter fluminis]